MGGGGRAFPHRVVREGLSDSDVWPELSEEAGPMGHSRAPEGWPIQEAESSGQSRICEAEMGLEGSGLHEGRAFLFHAIVS